ncbi:E3 ubiquitin-protein ligase At1g63170-like isoform X2 [Tripterygium wilfordii]|uniref:E3 ubiquitin-protein ligase At1g63170-like isoform X2 n=1 Tax=Tripterygium wilfordii TaxID=458696 RepID=UPI0018F7EC72|nr:E3 ubiquitin-protein ligase At1g63170-like isoform X2 [Tripterygium wilfordii]
MEVRRGSSRCSYSLLRHPTITSTLFLPLSRLITPRSDDDHEFCGENVGNDHHYSRPIVVLDVIWNLAFVAVSVLVLLSSIKERPSTPLRVWVCGYAFQCLLHLGFVYFEFRSRNDRCDDRACLGELSPSQRQSSIVKWLESLNTVISSVWWVIGCYWIVTGGQPLLQDSPRLYWLTVVFLAFDVFFIIFCIGMALAVFFAIFCCIPLVAIAYAVATRQGASDADIRTLAKYRYRQADQFRKLDIDEKQEALGARLELGDDSSSNELALHPDDSCCICLSLYIDGAELYSLPCNHHFHCGCISKWLRINAICPLCKLNIRRGDTLV